MLVPYFPGPAQRAGWQQGWLALPAARRATPAASAQLMMAKPAAVYGPSHVCSNGVQACDSGESYPGLFEVPGELPGTLPVAHCFSPYPPLPARSAARSAAGGRLADCPAPPGCGSGVALGCRERAALKVAWLPPCDELAQGCIESAARCIPPCSLVAGGAGPSVPHELRRVSSALPGYPFRWGTRHAPAPRHATELCRPSTAAAQHLPG